MAYKALYRSYRPINFDEVIGQKHVIQTLKNALKEDKISHAYVFCGLRGIGKTTVARILAKAVNCLNLQNGEPCNECANCKAINEADTTDIVELDAASNNGVDEIRNILDKVNFLPSTLKKKVYIIDEVHMLSSSAFNALLKTLEEPPAYVMFILATTEPHKIPTTILSRCQRFDFKQLTMEELMFELEKISEKENIKITDEALNGIAEAAEGGMRDALSILDQASVYAESEVGIEDVNAVTGNISNDKLIELVAAFNNDDGTLAINIVNELLNMGKEVSRLITCVIQFMRDILLYKSVDKNEFSKAIYNKEEFINLANNTDAKRLFYYIDVLVDVQNKIRFTNSQKIYLEVGIMKIVNSISGDLDVLDRISKLEDELRNDNPNRINQPNSNFNYDQKLLVLENKIKNISNELEKNDLNNFKDMILSKIGMLEDVTSKISTLPESLDERVRLLENSSIDKDTPSDIHIDNEKLISLEKEIESLKNNNPTDFVSFASSLTLLQTKVAELEEILKQDKNVSNDELILEINNLKEEITTLKERSDNEEELVLPTKRNNPYEFKPLDEDIFSDDKKESKENLNSNKADDEIYQRIAKLESTISLLNNREGVDLTYLEEKINKIDNITNDSNNNELKDAIEELKTNYRILAKTVAYMEQGSNNIIPDAKLISLSEEINNIKQAYLKLETYNELKLRVDNLENEINKLKLEEVKVEQKVEQKEENKDINPIIYNKEEINETSPILEEEKTEEEVVLEKKTLPVQEQTTDVVKTIDEEKDLTSEIYDVNILLRVLNGAFSKEAREEKTKLVASWRLLPDNTSTARMLKDGNLKAYGEGRIIITYNNAQLCNNLMEPTKHAEAKAILKQAFNKDYDFLAIPEEDWAEKRAEYHEQYSATPTSIRLTPFKNPQLKIVTINKKAIMSNHEKLKNKADLLFEDD